MVRTQIYLTEQERKALHLISEETGRTQSDLIREAVDRLVQRYEGRDRLRLLRKGRGLWKDREDLPDLRALRREWSAPEPEE